jgi:hypothetical protein
MVAMRARHLLLLLLALSLCACEEDEGGSTILDAVVASADSVDAAVEADPDMWLVDASTGTEVVGTLEGSSGGTIDVSGWRSTMEYVPGESQYLAYAEKLFFDIEGFNLGAVSLSGSLVVTRHSLDYGTNDKIDDTSRTTHYVGTVVANGDVTGDFTVDVHANASGTTLWTCGTINDEETGSGACF